MSPPARACPRTRRPNPQGVLMSSRNSVSIIFHVVCLAAMGTLPVATLADNLKVIQEAKHDLSRPLRDMAVSTRPVPSAAQQTAFPNRTGPAITTSPPDFTAQIPSGAPVTVQ